MKNIFGTIGKVLKSFKTYWRTPPEGRYMPYREIASLAGGSIGGRIIITSVGQMIIAVGNTLIGNTIGITAENIYIIYIISLIASIPLTALRASLIDNTRSMKGKYRPYIVTMGLPTVILGSLFVWMPYGGMGQLGKCVTVLLFNIAFQFFYNFFNDIQDNYINVLSPNSIERSDVVSIKNVVENISPSILNIIFPILAKLITGKDTLYDIRIFRYLYPPILFGGFLLSLIVYLNTEEKIVQAKSHFIEIKFIDALKQVARNKYFWIISLGGWLGFLEGSFNNIIGWMYSYQNACTPGQYSVITAVSGNASFWPNLFAPVLIRKYGKKRILVISNLMNIGFIAVMYPAVRSTGSAAAIWLMLLCVFINTLMTSLGHCLNPSINADIRDYQHYISGERIDGMFAAVGLVGNIISIVTGAVLPQIYKRSGLNETVLQQLKSTTPAIAADSTNTWDVLFNHDYFIHISTVLIVASVIGAVLNVIPYFFYDFTEVKQKAIVKTLKIRAMFEDYGNGTLSDEVLKEGRNIISEAREIAASEPVDLQPIASKLKSAKGEEAKAIRKELREAKKYNEDYEISEFILAEMDKYNSPIGRMQYEYALKIYEAGPDGYRNLQLPTVEELKASLPNNTKEEKAIRSLRIRYAKEFNAAKKAASKYFSGEVVPFDVTEIEELFKKEDSIDIQIGEVIKAAKKANESGNEEMAASLKNELDSLHIEKKSVKANIKEATDKNTYYQRAAKPYIDSVRVITQKNNYENLETIMAL